MDVGVGGDCGRCKGNPCILHRPPRRRTRGALPLRQINWSGVTSLPLARGARGPAASEAGAMRLQLEELLRLPWRFRRPLSVAPPSHSSPLLPGPCFPPGPSLLRHSARGDVGVGNSATHGGNATSERMALREGEDLFSLRISIDPIGGLSTKGRVSSRFRSPSTSSVGSSKSKQAGGRGVCRCAALCLSACCLFSALLPPPSPARPPLYPDEGQGPPHCSALFAARVYRFGGFSGQVRS